MSVTPLDHFRRLDRAMMRLSALVARAEGHYPQKAPGEVILSVTHEFEEALTAYSRLVESGAIDDIEGILAVTYGGGAA
ncbi:hypothetical protein [Oceaniglobus trochenteri]|uniref:hypothetical protein n=1 Tax=Oceaniglobus trochenteri TaxID=2763260 RepID=UPI001CFFACA3|nr:hypothetical protein [Oceaniglobus trochenteri]